LACLKGIKNSPCEPKARSYIARAIVERFVHSASSHQSKFGGMLLSPSPITFRFRNVAECANALIPVAISRETIHTICVGEGIFVQRFDDVYRARDHNICASHARIGEANRQSGKWDMRTVGRELHHGREARSAVKVRRSIQVRELKPADTSKQPISPALWQRIKTNGQKIGLDPRLGTELGRLALHDELTSMEVLGGLQDRRNLSGLRALPRPHAIGGRLILLLPVRCRHRKASRDHAPSDR